MSASMSAVARADDVLVVDQKDGGRAACDDQRRRLRLLAPGRLGSGRKPHLRRRPFARPAPEVEGAAELRAQAVDHRQAEAGAPPHPLGREEGLDRVAQGDGVHADAGVADRDPKILAGREQLPRSDLLGAGRDAEPAAAGHGVARVQCEVEDGELELVGIDPRRRKRLRAIDRDLDHRAHRTC